MPSLNFQSHEISKIRAQTPGVQNIVHFNNAGASLMSEVVAQRVIEYFQHELNFGGYETADKYTSELDQVYFSIARYLGCDHSEIAIMENATVAWGQAFLSIPFEDGDTILTSASEYASNYIGFLQMKERRKVRLEVIPNDQYGQVDVKALEGMMHDGIKLISISHVPTNGGLVNPAAEIGKIARKHHVWYLLDACQSVGQMPLDVKQIGCDFLSATSRKYLRGPRGVGFLYVSGDKIDLLEPSILDLHGAQWQSPEAYKPKEDARKFENWESNLAGIAGLAAAVDYMLELGIDRIWNRIQLLADHMRNSLNKFPGVEVQDLGLVKCGIVSFSTAMDAHELKKQLHQSGFNVSIIHPSHTLIDMQNRGLGFMIRASIHYYNTEEEVDKFINCLKRILK